MVMRARHYIASQFAVSHAGGENPITMINKFDTQRKAYLRIGYRKNQITKGQPILIIRVIYR